MSDNAAPWTLVDREDVTPVCPYCEIDLTEVHRRSYGAPFGTGETRVYFCPACRKVLGFSRAQVG